LLPVFLILAGGRPPQVPAPHLFGGQSQNQHPMDVRGDFPHHKHDHPGDPHPQDQHNPHGQGTVNQIIVGKLLDVA
jgi:hypothetical protein